MLRAVIFDMDDTLIDWSNREGSWIDLHQQHLNPIRTYLQEAGHKVPDLAVIAEEYADQSRLAWEKIDQQEWDCPSQSDILRETLRASKIEVEKIDMKEIQQRFAWSLIPGVKAFADSVEVLKTLRAAKIKTGLITNTAMPMWMRDSELKEVGLLDYLDVRLTAGDVGKLKPHPQPFRVAMERLNVTPAEAVFVGDRVQDDVAGAQLAGMRAIWVRRNTPEMLAWGYKPNATIDTLGGLLKVLDMWYPGWRKNIGMLA